jgi:acyl-CoA thioester hydrolase
MAARIVYRTPVQPDWIDYNQHLNDAYYVVAMSRGCDAFMDAVGIDAAYRASTQCTMVLVMSCSPQLMKILVPEMA